MRSPYEVDIYEVIDDWLSANHEALKDPHTPWIAAFIDLSAPGTTQGWVFGSWELPANPAASKTDSKSLSTLHKQLVHSLFHHIHDALVPAMPIAPPDSWCWLRDNGKWVSQPYSRAKVLFGTLHEDVRKLIDNKSVARIDAMYDKWIFGPETLLSNEATNGDTEAKGLPAAYDFGTLDERELQTVLDGTPVPRLLGYLKEVVNAGVYYVGDNDKKGSGKGDLVAYAFLGKDGSLGSLEVKSAHRGKGLAGLLSRELFRRQADTFSLPLDLNEIAAPGTKVGPSGEEQLLLGREEQEGWFSHADVGVENTGSQRVMEKLGGKMMWRVCWVEVDLDVLMGTKEWVRREEGEEGGGR